MTRNFKNKFKFWVESRKFLDQEEFIYCKPRAYYNYTVQIHTSRFKLIAP